MFNDPYTNTDGFAFRVDRMKTLYKIANKNKVKSTININILNKEKKEKFLKMFPFKVLLCGPPKIYIIVVYNIYMYKRTPSRREYASTIILSCELMTWKNDMNEIDDILLLHFCEIYFLYIRVLGDFISSPQ